MYSSSFAVKFDKNTLKKLEYLIKIWVFLLISKAIYI